MATENISKPKTRRESTKNGKNQESIQSNTAPDLGYQWKSNKLTIIHHIREPKDRADDIKASINRHAR